MQGGGYLMVRQDETSLWAIWWLFRPSGMQLRREASFEGRFFVLWCNWGVLGQEEVVLGTLAKLNQHPPDIV